MIDNNTLSLYLKDNCRNVHDSVDQLVMSVKPFDNKENYIRFLKLQAVFHKTVDRIYKDRLLNQKISGLADLARYDDVLLDMNDLQTQESTVSLTVPELDEKEGLGWLYCAEGSNIGAAFLYKEAQNNLGLSGTHGARHLAPHLEGRAKHWKQFCEQYNAMETDQSQRPNVLQGALNAFSFYKALVREIFAPDVKTIQA